MRDAVRREPVSANKREYNGKTRYERRSRSIADRTILRFLRALRADFPYPKTGNTLWQDGIGQRLVDRFPGSPERFEVGMMAMQLDRSLSPVMSKQAKKRHVAPIGLRPTFTVRELQPLSDHHIRRITQGLKIAPLESAYLRRGLQEIAGTLRRQRAQPNPSRSEARYELATLAHTSWLTLQATAPSAEAIAELRVLRGGMNGIAQSALWGGLDRHPDFSGKDFLGYLLRPDVDWSIVGDAAATGWALLTGGDYADGAAAIAVQDLIELYRNATRLKPTFSTKGTGEIGANGRQRQIGNSPCFKFIEALFAIVDPSVTARWLTGKVQAVLHPRKTRRSASSRQSFLP